MQTLTAAPGFRVAREVGDASRVEPASRRQTLPTAPAALPLADPTVERAAIFRFAWSAYLFLHHSIVYWAWFRLRNGAGQWDLDDTIPGLLMWSVAAITLLRRAPLRWFTALFLCHLVYELPALPKTANHTFLTILMNVTMLAAVGAAALRTRGRILARTPAPIDAEALYPRLMALLRLEVLVMYAFVVLHKLNADYFNPSYSAATNLYREIVEMYWFLPFPSGSWTDPFCIFGAIGCEAAIPLLLIFRRTRLAGVGLGLVFHLMLSPHANSFIFSFSTLLYAAYFLFLPADVLGEMRQSWATLLTNIRQRMWLFLASVFFPLGTVLAIRLLAPRFAQDVDLIDRVHIFLGAAVRFAWNLFALFNVFAFARAVWICRTQKSGRSSFFSGAREPFFRPAVSWMLVFPLAVVFNGLCPYLGLKTESAFAMYANLRTEGARNNHLFMPRVNLAGYQDDLVEIVGSSDDQLLDLKREGYGWTYFEFRRKLSRVRSAKFWVTFKRNGGPEQTLRYATDRDDPAFAPLPWYERRLLFFRDVQLGDSPQLCGH
jgi:hypothetical protein